MCRAPTDVPIYISRLPTCSSFYLSLLTGYKSREGLVRRIGTHSLMDEHSNIPFNAVKRPPTARSNRNVASPVTKTRLLTPNLVILLLTILRSPIYSEIPDSRGAEAYQISLYFLKKTPPYQSPRNCCFFFHSCARSEKNSCPISKGRLTSLSTPSAPSWCE